MQKSRKMPHRLTGRSMSVLASLCMGALVGGIVTASLAPEPAAANDTPRKVTYDFDGDGIMDTATMPLLGDYNDTAKTITCSVTFHFAGQPRPDNVKKVSYTRAANSPISCPEQASAATFAGDKAGVVLSWQPRSNGSAVPGALHVDSAGVSVDLPTLASQSPGSIREFADLNADGRTDVVTVDHANGSRYSYSLTAADGKPGATAATTLCGEVMGAASLKRHITDLDASSPGLDLISIDNTGTCGLSDGKASVLAYSAGDPRAKVLATVSAGSKIDPESLVFADADSDGTLDVTMAVTHGDGTTTVESNPIVGVNAEPHTIGAKKDPESAGDLTSTRTPETPTTSQTISPSHTPANDKTKASTPASKTTKAPSRKIATSRPSKKPAPTSSVASRGPAPKALGDKVKMVYKKHEVGNIPVLRNDQYSGKVTVRIVQAPRVGIATVDKDGRIRYDRRGKPAQSDELRYEIKDQHGRTSIAVLKIDVDTPAASKPPAYTPPKSPSR